MRNSSTPSVVSLKSEKSMDFPLNYKDSSYSDRGQKMRNSSTPSVVSLKSEKSMDFPLNYKDSSYSDFGGKMRNSSTHNSVSLRSEKSMDFPLNYKDSSSSVFGKKKGNSSAPSILSMKSEKSMDFPLNYKDSSHSSFWQKINSSTPSVVSMKSEKSMDFPLNYKDSSFSGFEQEIPNETSSFHTDLHSVFERLERETVIFIRWKLKKFHRLLTSNYPKHLGRRNMTKNVLQCEEGRKIFGGEEEFVNFLREFLRMKKLGDLVDSLSSNDSTMSPSKDEDKSEMFKLSEDDEQQFKDERSAKIDNTPSESSEHSSKTQKLSVFRNRLKPLHRKSQKANMEATFKNLEENIVTFVDNELKSFHKLLYSDHLHTQDEDEEVANWEEDQKRITKKAFMNMILEFLRRMKREGLAFALHNKSMERKCQSKLKSNLKMRLAYVFEGTAREGHRTRLNKIYTDLFITEGREEAISDHEVKQIEKALIKMMDSLTIRHEDILKPINGRDKPIRTVMTEGVAGIGKTVLTQKFALDWAEGKHNQDIQFTFPFSFRGLNMVKEKKFSLVELIHLFFPEMKESGICSFEHFRVLFIFDGLDECRFPLDLKTKEVLTDVTQSASLEVLLVNLIKGRLLPSARVWITTRPAAAHLIPPEFVDMMTEVRGFNDPQKEEYFRKRFTEEEESNKVLSHIKSSRSFYIMCHIPVFCWIIATVLEDAIKTREEADLPNSLTEMYILYLVVLSKVKNVKYDEKTDKNALWTPETRKIIKSLGKLAFEQLMKGNLFFYESDLTECGIDVRAASVYSGVFTEIFQEERGFFHQNVFCFVHLSIQEFLAALHVHLTFTNAGVNLLAEEESNSPGSKIPEEQHGELIHEHFYKNAVEKALKLPDGKLDLFLRFLIGLSLKTNQSLLQGFVTETETQSSFSQNLARYIKQRIGETVCLHEKVNFFYCLNELNDHSLGKEIEQNLKSGKLITQRMSSADWAALVNIIISTEVCPETFDLRKYLVFEEAQQGFLPFTVNFSKVILSCCSLYETSYHLLATAFKTECCILTDIDLSNNDMQDSGLKLLCEGISYPNCLLETLKLSGCLITREGCEVLASALASNPSHLKELDLSYNHPEEHGVALLSAVLENPNWALKTLRVEPSGSQFLKPGLRKYAVEPILDSTITHRNLTLSEFNRIMTVGQGEKLSWFDAEEELLGRHDLTGRCYWEVECRGNVSVGVTCKGIKSRGERNHCDLGVNDQSWALLCSKEGFSVLHNNKITKIFVDPSNKVGVYVDRPGGTVSFFGVYPDKMAYLHTYNTKFTEPVYPALRIEPEPVNIRMATIL